MTFIRILPNRSVVLVMTPREASMLEGQILDPADFPWQDSEALFVAGDIKAKLHYAVTNITAHELDASVSALTQMAVAQEDERRREEQRQQQLPETPPEPQLQEGEPVSRLIRIIDRINPTAGGNEEHE